MPRGLRRLAQVAIALVLAGAVILVTEWAYPSGHLSIRIGRPYYSRAVGEDAAYVTFDVTIQNVGTEPVSIDSEHFLLIDDMGNSHTLDPSTHFLRNHFNWLTMPAGYTIQAAFVFRIPPERRAASMLFVTPTGQFVQFRLPQAEGTRRE